MEEMGLAASQMGAQQGPTVEQVVALLMEGMTPDELMQSGVPEELVQQAMQVIMEQQQVPSEQAGLAASQVRPVE